MAELSLRSEEVVSHDVAALYRLGYNVAANRRTTLRGRGSSSLGMCAAMCAAYLTMERPCILGLREVRSSLTGPDSGRATWAATLV